MSETDFVQILLLFPKIERIDIRECCYMSFESIACLVNLLPKVVSVLSNARVMVDDMEYWKDLVKMHPEIDFGDYVSKCAK